MKNDYASRKWINKNPNTIGLKKHLLNLLGGILLYVLFIVTVSVMNLF